jgi:hypothetical protein
VVGVLKKINDLSGVIKRGAVVIQRVESAATNIKTFNGSKYVSALQEARRSSYALAAHQASLPDQ